MRSLLVLPVLLLLVRPATADHKSVPIYGWSYYRLPNGPTVIPPVGSGHKPGPAVYSPLPTFNGPVNPPHTHRFGLGWFGFRSPSPRPKPLTVDIHPDAAR